MQKPPLHKGAFFRYPLHNGLSPNPYTSRKERTKRFVRNVLSFSLFVMFLLSQKVMLFAPLIMMLLAKARNDVLFAHYAVRRNIIHAVNITA